ncbi:carbohydrate ABC transporter permease [Defluviitalea phaphyphila]|uniref:carbohydrate ABC transporter permease n=1 Tax=Defluviitalea phaphyphila TaxID=1473580 RepID=UPI0007314721|nr:sugar ABC transporter permease [Defluviitalea phaphyphila]
MKKKVLVPYLYIIPGLFMVLFFVYIPVVSNFIYSFFRLSSYSAEKIFVGFENYIKLFTDEVFLIMIRNNIYYAVISLIVQVGIGTMLAILIESKYSGKFRNLYRNIYFIPALISLTAVGLLFKFVYSPDIGLLNSALRFLNLDGLTHAWLGESKLAIFCVIAMSQWQFTGYITVLMVVAVQNIPKEYLEAAEIDGAGPIKKVINVMLPLVKEQLLVCSIITIIGAFKLFTEIYTTTSGGPGNSSQVLGVYLYQNAFLHDDMGLAAATGVLIFIITVGISIIQINAAKSGEV